MRTASITTTFSVSTRTRLALLAAALVSTLLWIASSGASTHGALDGAGHPAVGVLVAQLDGANVPLCTGTLVAPTVFLTAGHCTSWLPAAGITRVWVSFDTTLDSSQVLVPGVYHTDPAYGHGRADLHDLAVVLLDRPVAGVRPAALPAAGLLDTLARKGVLKRQLFTAVGYGSHVRVTGSGRPQFLSDGARHVATTPFATLDDAWLALQASANAPARGAVCYGDSGGAQFLGDTNVLVALTTGGDATCSGLGWNSRLDTPSARSFLGVFVALR